MLLIQAVSHSAAVIAFPLPLVHGPRNSFALAHDGLAVDANEFERRWKREQRPLRGDFDFPYKK
jgi:hypothetical protein